MIGSHSRQTIRNRPVPVLWYVLLVLCAPLLAGVVTAEDNPVTIAEQQLRDIKQELEQGVTSGDRYAAMMQDIDRIQRQAQACIDDTGRQVQKLAGDLESLGAEAAGEDVSVTRARRDLERNKNAVEKKLAVCRLLRVNATELDATIAALQKQIFTKQITAREQDFTSLMKDDWGEVNEWLAAVKAFIIDTRGLEQVGGLQWMLSDPWGRVRVPLGVAYGSDTTRVMQILVDAANKHPQVMNNYPGIPEPRVLFIGFGDSSLDFELRCVIRDVDRRLQTRSDLYLAIDTAFREAGIEIPFPQRDLHFRNALPAETVTPAARPPET